MIVNASTGTVENTIALPTCDTRGYPTAVSGSIAVTPTGGWAFVVVNSTIYGQCGPVVPINLKTQKAQAPISGTGGSALAVSPTGQYLYASAGSSVDAIDLTTRKLVGTIPIAGNAVAFSPDGSLAYIAGAQNGAKGVAVLDTSSLAVTNFISAGGVGGSESIAVSEDGTSIYLGGIYNGGNVSVIDAQSLKIAGHLLLGAPLVVH